MRAVISWRAKGARHVVTGLGFRVMGGMLWRRSNTRQLKASGSVLTQLTGALDGQLFSSVVWRMTLDPAAAARRLVAAPASPAGPPPGDSDAVHGAAQQQQPAELPYHRYHLPWSISAASSCVVLILPVQSLTSTG